MESETVFDIRVESPTDVEAIHRVTIAAFRDAPHSDHTEQFIVSRLRESGALSLSLVAERCGEVVGHAAASPVAISDRSIGWYGIGPVSVVPELQRRGIGILLINTGLRMLKERGAAGCVVLGDPRYYSRFGFSNVSDLLYPEAPAEYFLALSFEEATPRGVVAYHEAFSARE